MIDDTRLLREFIYTYTEFVKYLISLAQPGHLIASSMVLLMANAIVKQGKYKRSLKRVELVDERLVNKSTIYRQLLVAVKAGLLIKKEDGTYYFPHTLPIHLKDPRTIPKHIVGTVA